MKHKIHIRRAVTALALALLIAASSVGMTGCNDIAYMLDPEPYYPIPTTRPAEELNSRSITAVDVLAQLDAICMKALEQRLYESGNLKKAEGHLSAQFTSLKVGQEPLPDPNTTENYGFKDEPFYYNRENKYSTTLYYNGAYKKDPNDFKLMHVYISPSEFENIMRAFGKETVELTEDMIKPYGERGTMFYGHMIGDYVYEPFAITREVIENANKAQLWAIYLAATNSMLTLNAEKFYNPEIHG